MKVTLLIWLLMMCSSFVFAFNSEQRTIRLFDGEEITARLCLPDSGETVRTIVVVVHGTGPNTYLNKRQGFVYYDVIAEGFCAQGVGFCSYNRRGVDVGDTPPMFDAVDSVKFAGYTPITEAEDIESIVREIKSDKRFENCKILLYGLSEGTVIAPLVAERKKVGIDGLLLHGYANENMYDIIEWQDGGVGVMIMVNQIFDKNGDRAITPDEYNAEDKVMQAYRNYFFQSLPFDSIDVVKDGVIDQKDIYKIRMQFHETLMQKIAEEDNHWIWTNYFRITTGWLRSHFALEPNKSRMLRLDIPIDIFHGTDDANVPVEGVYDIEQRFKACGKSNLRVSVFEKHNHDLNFEQWIKDQTFSEGLQKVFSVAGSY